MVLDRFSCLIEERAVTCVMGPSGRGKTTLLRIMMGLEQPDSGQVNGMAKLRKSAVFQENRLCENLSAASNIRLVCREPVALRDIIDSMSAIGLNPDCAKQPVRIMSGGQRRRIAILRALMAEYDVLFLDEPFKGLDAETKERTMKYARERNLDKTVVLVTHDESECEAMGGRIIYV